jgi:hypothetical protein
MAFVQGRGSDMGLALGIAGISVMCGGLVLVGLGAYLAWREEARQRRDQSEFRGVAGILHGLAALADALAKHPIGVRLVFLGIVVIVVGGAIAGVGGLAG